MTIENGKVVGLAYTLKNHNGIELDRADLSQPFYYLHGAGQMIPGLETEITGLAQGAKKSVTVAPADGYGEYEEALKMKVPRSNFPADAELAEGLQFAAQLSNGQQTVFTVTAIHNDAVEVDGNHPLAGQTLYFDIEVLEIRDATAEETAHGHAHGPGGHHHH